MHRSRGLPPLREWLASTDRARASCLRAGMPPTRPDRDVISKRTYRIEFEELGPN